MDSPVLTAAQMRAAENAAFDRGITAEALMDQAGAGIARAVSRFFPTPGRCVVFAGKGNNAGDALVAAEHLASRRLANRNAPFVCRKRLRRIDAEETAQLCSRKRGPRGQRAARKPSLHISLFSMACLVLARHRPCANHCAQLVARSIACAAMRNAFVFAVDLPTGLDGDSGKADRDCVVADFTVTIGFAKHGLIADNATNFVGRLEVIPLAELSSPQKTATALMASAAALRSLCAASPLRRLQESVWPRSESSPGRKDFTGAAIMCSLGALRAGAGLVEVFVPEEIYEIVAAAAPAEAMVKPVRSYRDLPNESIDVWAVGPGLGREHADEIVALIQSARQPMVVDADALNVLSGKTALLKRCKGPRLLTPHPGEIKRIFGCKKGNARADRERLLRANSGDASLQRQPHNRRGTSIIRSATTRPAIPEWRPAEWATCLPAFALRSSRKNCPCYDAARLGAWVCGRAAEISIFNGGASEQSLLPTDVLQHLGAAFNDLRENRLTSNVQSRLSS